ncbi:sigma-54-dependent transcriptional regulator [Marinobacterium lutimaris]|uniref:DNA-binding transcriptional response regulator, NtrC family, contains REC, AAA-type ATPase, and a Fis-type DNA-binding domains n=1 Tax=Marinobacterium lutimaris TaxID=568106 RepID=A0A1H5Y4H0_9GAMM|nr:sigma-54 dependent transcriptional regulator [Marinobacterium lutimaris]SEG18426.1 DNA-binding transcriptional response regulator, NtrC family, contains REC, AAA-type ATPase, and a Fis-type DNA-binding domains [Marinobacterium lutimaris]
MSTVSVLVIDDEHNLVRSIRFALHDQQMTVVGAHTGAEGLAMAETTQPDVILLDLGLPDISGLEVLTQLKAAHPEVPVIMISAHGDTRAAVKAVKDGAIDYLTKPFDWDELVLQIRRSSEHSRMARELAFLRRQQSHTRRLVGYSQPMQRLHQMIEQVGGSSAKTLLITGPSGTGKALIARSLHDIRFKDGPFIEVNCAALPEQLIEAELFGAERGAYTGANQRRTGLIGLADGGTLFLDEIGELPLPLQAKLLSFLENRSYRPIGGCRELQAEVLVIAATNRDLKAEVDAGSFRSDLFFRLNVLPIQAPPLHERREDVELLIKYFSELFATQEGCAQPIWSPGVIKRLQFYDWPGNVRELRNLVERMTILYPGEEIQPHLLPDDYLGTVEPEQPPVDDYTDAVEARERELILEALRETGGRKGQAAERLGISRHALKRRIQRLGLEG